MKNIHPFTYIILASSDKPSECDFNYGLCGWNTTGNPTWIWHPSKAQHFAAFLDRKRS